VDASVRLRSSEPDVHDLCTRGRLSLSATLKLGEQQD
jgi:hypothetical protein